MSLLRKRRLSGLRAVVGAQQRDAGRKAGQRCVAFPKSLIGKGGQMAIGGHVPEEQLSGEEQLWQVAAHLAEARGRCLSPAELTMEC